MNAETKKYISKIRNEKKRLYAESYALFLLRGGVEPEHGSLSYMAAQAVRLHLFAVADKYYDAVRK